MKKQIDVVKEKRDLKILEIIRNVLLFIAFFLGVLIFCLDSKASPMNDNTVSANLTISIVKDYIDNKVAQNGAVDNVLIDNSSAIMDNLEDIRSILPSEIQAFTYPSATAPSIIDTSDLLNAYENNDLSYFVATFNLQSTSDLSNLDDYFYKYSDYIVDSIESDICIYNCPSPSHVGDMVNLQLDANYVESEIYGQYSNEYGEIFPIYYYRWRDDWCSCSFQNEPSDNICVDGLVLDSRQASENWSNFVNNVDFYSRYGYLPQGSPVTIFNFYFNGVKVNAPFYHSISHITAFPSFLEIWGYDTISGEGIRCQSALFGTDGDIFLFYRSEASYLKFNQMSTKFVLPYDFSLNFPNTDFSTLDFSQILKAIRDNGVLETRNTQELYRRLNETFEQGIQDIIDGQKTTNELLLSLLRYYEKNIVKTGENITDILLDINKAINNISSPDDEEISYYLDTIIQDPSLENRLKHIFPFGVFQDVKDLTDLLDEVTVLEPRWDFRLNVGLFEEKYIDYSIDLTTVPEIDTFRSFWFFFILLSFNLLCLSIEYKFLCMFMGGGD